VSRFVYGVNPVLEAQSVVRQQIVNRVFGSAYAEYQITNGLTYRVNFGPDYTQLTNGCFNGPWTHGTCANLGANSSNQGQPPQAGQVRALAGGESRGLSAGHKVQPRQENPNLGTVPRHAWRR